MNLAYKKYLVNLQKFWELGRPPPCWEKFPNNDVFFSESVRKNNNSTPFHFGQRAPSGEPPPVIDERPKSPAEKSKINLKFFSHVLREEKPEIPFISFERKKRNLKEYSQLLRGERDIKP